MEIHTGPRILTIMLKRYTKLETGRCIKLHDHVKFAERLHLQENPYPKPARKVEYCLIGVVVHVGSMDLGKGHYVVYFRGDRKGRRKTISWYLASDADVTEVSLGEVLCCDAYMLFYGNR
ncbi:hypothetical protein MKX03_029766 [Papaver bracteatum]|nr:hypothetical protein MKX03_029766 [Papaver bracteatum]